MTKNETWEGAREFPVTGHYFELLATANQVDLEAYAADGRRMHFEQDVETGFYIDRRGLEPFARIVITTGASEAVEFLWSDAITGYRGRVDVSDRASRVLGSLAARAHTCATATAAAASAVVLAANASRTYLQVQNQDAAESVYITSDGDDAAANGTSLKLGPGDVWAPNVPPTGALKAIRGGSADVTLNVIEAS